MRATDDFAWLDEVSAELRGIIAETSTLRSGDSEIANLDPVVARVQSRGLDIPQTFLRFMRDTSLHGKVPSCTACFLSLSEDAIAIPGAEDYFLLRFMNDSQSCVLWYLLMSRDEIAGVVASPYFFDKNIFEGMQYTDEFDDERVNYKNAFKEASICADTFAEFMYRFWVENTIWYSLYKRLGLTAVQEEYLGQITKKL